jgi:hypothetical protein
MNPHTTCSSCLHNISNRCANEASRYHGAPLKSWNTCSQHAAPQPTRAQLLTRLATCAVGLDWRAEKVTGDCRDYYKDRSHTLSIPERQKASPFRKTPFSIELALGRSTCSE